MKKNKIQVLSIIILIILTFATFLCLFSAYFSLNIKPGYGFLTMGITVIYAICLIVLNIIKLVQKKAYLALEMTSLAFSVILIFINIIFIIVYFLLLYIE